MKSKEITEHTSPLNQEQADQLNRLVEGLVPEQANWISGYLAGLSAASSDGQQPPPGAVDQVPVLTVLYGSETGNAERVATQAAAQAEARGLRARALDMADYKLRELKKEKFLMIVTATHGEGDPPDPAEEFHEFVHSRKAPKLEGTRFAVLSLGDSSYEYFCQTGKDFDARLAELGAERLHERVDCDVDYDEQAEQWIEAALGVFAERAQASAAPSNVVAFSGQSVQPGAAGYDRKNPFPAEVLENLVLTGRGSNKETRHIELSLEGSGLVFEPGDALSVVPRNRPEVVADLIAAMGFKEDEIVRTPTGELPLGEALHRVYEITTLTPPFLEAYAEYAQTRKLQELLQASNRKQLTEYRWGRHIIDVVQEFPVRGLGAQVFVDMLRKLQPREYSIASSYNANPENAHITVAAVRYHSNGRDRHGVASTHLADQVRPGDTVPVYITRNKNFKLPEDPATSVIMIGPGTGVAPFRAFVEEREYQGTAGRNWLIFGEQHFRTDFLYQTEWQRWLRDGSLTRMDVAFSRDFEMKVYVQDRMRENSRELYAWLEEGAYIYVCGDAERMAPDVDTALHDVVAKEGGLSADHAAEYVKTLQREKRYQRDVY